MSAVVSDYAQASADIISSNTPEGYNCTVDISTLSGKNHNQKLIKQLN